MYERRRQAASLGSLLVVTLLFVWACSSGDHEEASVTTSGGSGSKVDTGSAIPAPIDEGSGLGSGGTSDNASPPAMNEGGSATDSPSPDPDPSTGGETDVSSGGAGHAGSPPLAMGGTIGMSDAGAPGAGSPAAAGKAASAGAPAVVEPECNPANDPSTPDMFLPCDVATALHVCRNCHSEKPASGVHSSYVTFADIKPNAAQIYGVIKSGTMPWPPATLTTWQKTTVLKWLGKNGTCAIGATTSCQ